MSPRCFGQTERKVALIEPMDKVISDGQFHSVQGSLPAGDLVYAAREGSRQRGGTAGAWRQLRREMSNWRLFVVRALTSGLVVVLVVGL
jgi:hypothetical protein